MFTLEFLFKIDKVLYERQTETLCITSNIEELIQICRLINCDYNVTVWIDGKFVDVFMDPDEFEIRQLFT